MSQGGEPRTGNRLSQLDQKCIQILSILLDRGELRFTQLKAILLEYRVKMPEATLLDHLRHLTGKKLVLRRLIDVKNVTYRPNIEKFEEFQGFLDEVAKSKKKLAEMKNDFLSSSIEDQITEVLRNEIALNLEALKSTILFEKYGKFEDGFKAGLYQGNQMRILTSILIQRCLQDEEYRKKVFREIEVLKKRLVEG